MKQLLKPQNSEQAWHPNMALPTTLKEANDPNSPAYSASVRPDVKPLKPLTKKQAAFVKYLVDNPKASATEAAKATYNVTTENSASQVGSENLVKPQILTELAKYSGSAENTLITVMEYSKRYGDSGTKEGASYASVAVQSANSILDRLHGKATTKIEQSITAVTLNIDLTGVAEENK